MWAHGQREEVSLGAGNAGRGKPEYLLVWAVSNTLRKIRKNDQIQLDELSSSCISGMLHRCISCCVVTY